MTKHKTITLALVAVMGALLLSACESDSDDVATLEDATSAQGESSSAQASDPVLDNEA